jgi:poly(A) polymerase
MERQREAAVKILRVLRARGHTAYFAGGCVRDELLGLTPEDFDVATDARPDEIRRLYPRANEVGAAFGVMLVREGGFTVEVVTFRREWGYSDKRRPDQVEYAQEFDDAQRRDFTMNALFLDPLAESSRVDGLAQIRGRVIDHVGGIRDIKARLVRAVGDPAVRLAEDHLRALRAVRFAARFGFQIEEETAQAIREHASQLTGVSRERIGDEVRRMLGGAGRDRAIALFESLGLALPVFGEADTAWAEDGGITQRLRDDDDYVRALLAWRLDAAANPSALQIRAGAGRIVSDVRSSLCLSNAERDRLVGALGGIATLESDWATSGTAARKRLASNDWFADAIALVRARDAALASGIESDVGVLEQTPSGLAPTPLINGEDLIAMGLAGPEIGRALNAIYDEQLEDRIATRDEGLTMARTLASESP